MEGSIPTQAYSIKFHIFDKDRPFIPPPPTIRTILMNKNHSKSPSRQRKSHKILIPKSPRIEHPSLLKTSSILIPKSKCAESGKVTDIEISNLKFKRVGSSEMSLFKRPKIHQLFKMKELGIGLVVTLVSECELPFGIGQECTKLGIKWMHIPMFGIHRLDPRSPPDTFDPKNINNKGNNKLSDSKLTRFGALVLTLHQQINRVQCKFVVHCALGIHRTGIVGYALLRLNGYGKEEGVNALKAIRMTTYRNMGQVRINFVDQVLLPYMYKVYKEELRQPLTS